MSTSVVFWKEEPVSPLSYYDEAAPLDDPFYQTTLEQFANDVKFEAEEDIDIDDACESKAEIASQLLENLENLMDLDDLIKEEPFLLDEKMMVGGLLDDVASPQSVPVGLQDLKPVEFKQSDTQYLLNEFETVYDVMGFTHNALTPPQSPPEQQQPMLTNLQPILINVYPVDGKNVIYSAPEKPLIQQDSFCPAPEIIYPESIVDQVPAEDAIAHELAVVDELVRSRVEDMQWSNNSSSPGSPGDSSNCGDRSPGGSSNFGDCSSSEDPEWTPDVDGNNETPIKSPRKRRSYLKSAPEEKKVRKKEQNKNAATRYRLKKKAEVEVILSEEKQLLEKNSDLKNNISDLQREIKYLKGLMRDLFKAKGLIN